MLQFLHGPGFYRLRTTDNSRRQHKRGSQVSNVYTRYTTYTTYTTYTYILRIRIHTSRVVIFPRLLVSNKLSIIIWYNSDSLVQYWRDVHFIFSLELAVGLHINTQTCVMTQIGPAFPKIYASHQPYFPSWRWKKLINSRLLKLVCRGIMCRHHAIYSSVFICRICSHIGDFIGDSFLMHGGVGSFCTDFRRDWRRMFQMVQTPPKEDLGYDDLLKCFTNNVRYVVWNLDRCQHVRSKLRVNFGLYLCCRFTALHDCWIITVE